MSVSLCVLRIEVDEDLPEMADNPADIEAAKEQKKKDRGSRESKTITVETYASVVTGPNSVPGVLPTSSRKSPPEGSEKAETISFFCGNPLVEVTKGILHLYKENELRDTEEAKTLCLLSVPGALGASDLLAFGAACQQDIAHVRILRDGSPDHYMALFTFRSASAAREFYSAFDGVPYSSLEPTGVCHMAWVSRVESARDGAPPPTHTELPICPVCLERMDESVAGVLSVQCAHAFHAECLARWSGARCPVCRAACTPEPRSTAVCAHCDQTGADEEGGEGGEGGEGDESQLNVSGVAEGLGGVDGGSLWICLVCGHVGCGRYERGHAAKHFLASNHTYALQIGSNNNNDDVCRYERGHAAKHFLASNHTYALQIGSNRVWDYAGDNFVHRLVQNKPDGKLVAAGGAPDDDDKLDAAQLEFTYILTQQLDAQRAYFTDIIAKLESKHTAENEQLRSQNTELLQQVSSLCHENHTLERKLNEEKKNLEKKLNQVTSKVTSLSQSLSAERELAAALARSQAEWRTRAAQHEHDLSSQVSELKEQLRDVMFFVEARDKLQAAAADGVSQQEISQASVSVPPPAKPRRRKR